MIRALFEQFAPPPATAQEWLARAKSGRFTANARRELESWLAADPQHRKDYEQCLLVSQLGVGLRTRGSEVKGMPAYAALHRKGSPRATSKVSFLQRNGAGARFALGAGLASALGALVIFFAIPRLSIEETATTVATRHGEQRELPLEDGTRVHLNTDTALQVAFSDQERRVRLSKGEGFFDVTKDSSGRPFVVEVGATEVRVVGTRFSVRATDAGADVIVAEGKVEVVPDVRRYSPSIPGKVELVPGNALRFDRLENHVRIAAVDPERATAWRSGAITFDNQPVDEVIAEVNRYVRLPFVIADDRIRAIRLSGSFKVGDVESVRFALQSLGVESTSDDQRIVLRQP